MNDKDQRIAISEYCGFKHQEGEEIRFGGGPQKREGFFDPNGKFLLEIPDYLNDLNACHEMEKTLTEANRHTYKFKLHGFKSIQVGLNSWHATAAQRCEAFLKTVGKWKEAQK